jgi:hypothetical protein
MENQSGNYFGAEINTAEIADGSVTLVKLAGDAQLSLISIPIGGVMAWLKTYTNTPALGSNFVECNGQVLSDAGSVYNGQTIPNLNASRFLRGQATSGGTGGSETHTHTLTLVSNAAGNQAVQTIFPPATSDATSTLPTYYNVVWIMRIK